MSDQKNCRKLAAAELEIMEFFWASEEEKCKRDVLAFFATEHKSGSTISYFLSTLAKKGFLIPRREGRNFFYKPAVSRLQYEQQQINQDLNKTYGQSLETILANFCGKPSPSREELADIQRWLEQLEQELRKESP